MNTESDYSMCVEVPARDGSTTAGRISNDEMINNLQFIVNIEFMILIDPIGIDDKINRHSHTCINSDVGRRRPHRSHQ